MIIDYDTQFSSISLSRIGILYNADDMMPTKELILNGLIFVDEFGNPIDSISRTIGIVAETIFGTTKGTWNQHFHRIWNKVADSNFEDLVWEQIIHYFSTYGLESICGNACPVLPVEKLQLPEYIRPDGFNKFIIIQVLDIDKAKDKIMSDMKSIQRPSDDQICSISLLLDALFKDDDINVDDFKSSEIECIVRAKTYSVSTNGEMLLRCLVYLATGTTMLIKNTGTINSIKIGAIRPSVTEFFKKVDLVELSKIFLRFKPLFLAFRSNPELRPIVNKIRRLAVTNHQPVSPVTIANISKLMSNGEYHHVSELLKKATIRNLIKIYNFALNAQFEGSQIYTIRNGKIFVASRSSCLSIEAAKALENACRYYLEKKLKDKFAYQRYYIPEGVWYPAPVSEKQFIGGIPYGTRVSAPGDIDALCASIAWHNYEGVRTDIDLHLVSAEQSYGWNSSYRSETRDVLYSGDMTDATNGATETFRVQINNDVPYIVSCNLYNLRSKVPFHFFLSSANDFRKCNDGMIDVSKALTMPIKLTFNGRSMTVGYLLGNTFTFYGGDLGDNVVPKLDLYKDALEAIINRTKNMISLEDILLMGGAMVIKDPKKIVDDIVELVDLSPENVMPKTFFDIIDLG